MRALRISTGSFATLVGVTMIVTTIGRIGIISMFDVVFGEIIALVVLAAGLSVLIVPAIICQRARSVSRPGAQSSTDRKRSS